MNIAKLLTPKKLQIPLIRAALSTTNDGNNILINSPDNPNFIVAKIKRRNESIQEKKARLLYQSRKRGMLENDLLLSTFAAKYLDAFDEHQVAQYDKLINEPSNDWDLYNWAVGKNPTPEEYNFEVMKLFKEHVKNTKKETRFRQPDLN